MRKSELKALRLLDEIELLSLKIREVILHDKEFQNIDIIDGYYSEKQLKLDDLEKLNNRSHFLKNLSIESDWNKKIQNILEIEKKNIKLLENNTDKLNCELKNLFKKSSLMLYTK